MRRSERLGAALGAAGIVGNVFGVAALADVPNAYRPGTLDAWASQAVAHPAQTAASAIAFSLGLLALAGWAQAAARWVGGRLSRAAASAIAASAVVNAAGSLAPLVLVLHVAPACANGGCGPVARALLGFALSADALFDLLLGAALVLLGARLAARGRSRLGALGVAAGVATLPVSLQVVSTAAAKWLAVAGPFWLLFVAWSSALMWRRKGGAFKARHAPETPLARAS
ncbi:MAG TPA: hypothetical protein VMT17_13085 [Anaeromyxobacteraceae bacterium]|nr:hypothetical protein [Anaeromyxobacteraceae bacterium]